MRRNSGLEITTALFFAVTILSIAEEMGRTFQGRILPDQSPQGSPFKSVHTAGTLECAHRCLTQPTCVSFSYNSTGGAAGRGVCGLHRRARFPAEEERLPHRGFGHVFVQKFVTEPKSCLDQLNNGERMSGTFVIYDGQGSQYKVYCDMTSEKHFVWTLVMSQSYDHRSLRQLRDVGLMLNASLNEDEPNWSAYRLSHARMRDLRSHVTHWRVTCSFPLYDLDYRDYVRAEFSEFDPLSFSGNLQCKRVQYINVRGHNCTNCTATWSQLTWLMLHHRSDRDQCELGKAPGTTGNEQCFGYYNVKNRNPAFRCTETGLSSTNYWFGSPV